MKQDQHGWGWIARRLLVLLLVASSLTACGTGSSDPSSQVAVQNQVSDGNQAETLTQAGAWLQIHLLDAQHGWALTNRAILTTGDGGTTWLDVTPTSWEDSSTANVTTQVSHRLVSGFFLDNSHAWVVGMSTNPSATDTAPGQQKQALLSTLFVLYTTNGGVSWYSSKLPVSDPVGAVNPAFVDAQEGWIVAAEYDAALVPQASGQNGQRVPELTTPLQKGVLLQTTDGGKNWQQQGTLDLAGVKEGLAFCLVTKSANGQQSGQGCDTQASAQPPQGVVCTNGQPEVHGWVTLETVKQVQIYRTLDGGANWSQVTLTPPGSVSGAAVGIAIALPPAIYTHDGVLPVEFLSGQVQSLTATLDLYQTRDGGQTWGGATTTEAANVPFIDLEDYAAVDMQHFYQVVSTTKMENMLGGGQQTPIGQDEVMLLDFSDARNGLASTGTSLLRTSDGGATWTPLSNATITKATTTTISDAAQAPAPQTADPCAGNNQNSGPSQPPAVEETTSGPRTFTFVNNTGQTIWVGALGNAGQAAPGGGGWTLAPGATSSVHVPDNWGGRFWGRTYCNFNNTGAGSCETGDCGGVLLCNGAGGIPPATLAEFTLDGAGGHDFYDVSYVDGFNVPMTITPVGGAQPIQGNPYWCGVAGCGTDLNPNCPSALQEVDSNGRIVACKSACEAFNTDQYCCRGAFGSSATCNPQNWPVDYAAYFKDGCPTAYSYAYDDPTSTFQDQGAGYKITFGPASGGG